MNKHGGSSPDVSTLSIPLKSSTASQTDLRGEVSNLSIPHLTFCNNIICCSILFFLFFFLRKNNYYECTIFCKFMNIIFFYYS